MHTPLLMPRNRKLYEHNEASYLMDHCGMLVMLPYDLRVSMNIIFKDLGLALPSSVVLKQYGQINYCGLETDLKSLRKGMHWEGRKEMSV